MGWGRERDTEEQTQYMSVLCVRVRMTELMAKIRSVAYEGNLFRTCTGTKEHICDDKLQGGILRNDFMFASLPLLFQVTPSSAVSVLQTFSVFCHCPA